MQRVVLSSPTGGDQTATNLSLKDNNITQYIINQGGLATSLLNNQSQTITTVQPQPTSPLPVQLLAAQPFPTPDNNEVLLGDGVTDGMGMDSIPMLADGGAMTDAMVTDGGMVTDEDVMMMEGDDAASQVNGSSLDLRVTNASEEAKKSGGGGKKRANIFSITEKLMKQKQAGMDSE